MTPSTIASNSSGKPHSHGGGVRWEMLVSHHPPCDYDRTFILGRVRVCTRCFAVMLGALCAFFTKLFIFSSSMSGIWVAFALPLPASLDFTAHELAIYRSNNIIRFLSGSLLGVPVGLAVHAVVMGSILFAILTVFWFVGIAFSVAFLFRRTGHIDVYISKYERAVRKTGRN